MTVAPGHDEDEAEEILLMGMGSGLNGDLTGYQDDGSGGKR
jgi:hypothetical protein